MTWNPDCWNVVFLTDTTDVVTVQKTLGTYKVAHELRQAGFQTTVINNLHTFEFSELLSLLSQLVGPKTLFVGFNNMFYQDISDPTITEQNGVYFKPSRPGAMLPHGLQVNSAVKSHIQSLNPHTKLVLGGPTAHDASYNRDFDFIVSGYADVSVVNLARHLQDHNIPLEKSYRSVHGPVLINDSRAESFDFANSNMQWHPFDLVMADEVLPIEMARGCIFKCTFCSYPLNGKKKLDFIKDPEHIYQELVDSYQRYGITRYKFVDDTFNDSVEKCRMIWEISQRLPFQLEYWAYIRLDLMTAHPETIDWLFDSGLRGCYFGIETFDHSTAKLIGKGGHRDRLIQTLRNIKQRWGNQVMLHGSFIFGLPHESVESMQRTKEFLLGDDCPLDSWFIQPLQIKANADNWTAGFLSDLDRDYVKYGYEKLGEKDYDMLWANEHTTFETVREMVNSIHQAADHRKIASSYVFQLASLGYDLSDIANCTIKEFDWHGATLKKAQRALEYKSLLKQQLGLN
jgi:radical SAM superfamily enzyme YgiQ (UPF0313 family)